jgi:hypothetical protein
VRTTSPHSPVISRHGSWYSKVSPQSSNQRLSNTTLQSLTETDPCAISALADMAQRKHRSVDRRGFNAVEEDDLRALQRLLPSRCAGLVGIEPSFTDSFAGSIPSSGDQKRLRMRTAS